MAQETAAVASVETKDEATRDEASLVRTWLDAISIASKEEEDWREAASKVVDLYRQQSAEKGNRRDTKKKFNILYSNTETVCPALYNSVPVPDVRRRFADADPVAKSVADILERCLSYSVDSYDFDKEMRDAVKDMELPGRAVSRVRYKPYVGAEGTLDFEEVSCEHVSWKHFRRGPGERWSEVPWVAFELFLTRDELVRLSSKYGEEVELDCEVPGAANTSDARKVPEVFKRARVWEIWDKDAREAIFIATGFKERPIRREPDPLGLTEFFPVPRPLYSTSTTESLVPIIPYDCYREQAEELERISKRIQVVTEAIRARGLYDSRMSEADKLVRADDAELVAIENPAVFADDGGLDKKIWFWPSEKLVMVLKELFEAREQIKTTIYELTGISDILRGSTNPNETLGAQQIKTQWGSLRIQNKQSEVQRYARDLFRIKAEIIASKFQPQTLEMMTGIPLVPAPTDPPEVQQQKMATLQLLRSDAMRGFKVDVETDSTIRADSQRNQQNMSQFLQGAAQYAQAMGPIGMQFPQMMPTIMEVFSAFARHFKLGKSAEDALDKVSNQALQMAQQPPPPDPRAEMEKQNMVADQQAKQAELEMKMHESQAKLAFDQQSNQQKMDFEAQKHAQGMEFERRKHEADIALRAQDMQMRQVEGEHSRMMQAEQHREKMGIEREKMAMGQKPAAEIRLDANEAVKGMTPLMDKQTQVLETAALGLAQAAEALERVAEVMAADNEIVRDQSGRAVGSRKKINRRAAMN